MSADIFVCFTVLNELAARMWYEFNLTKLINVKAEKQNSKIRNRGKVLAKDKLIMSPYDKTKDENVWMASSCSNQGPAIVMHRHHPSSGYARTATT
jgi:hypothetical protein